MSNIRRTGVSFELPYVVCFVMVLMAGMANGARGNFEATISPPMLEAGKPTQLTISTQNMGLPAEAATIEYSVAGIKTATGMPVPVDAPMAAAKGPAFAPVKLTITVPGDFPGGMAQLLLRGLVKDAAGGEIGPKDFALNVSIGGAPAEPAAPCGMTVTPPAIELTRDSKATNVTVKPNSDCTDAEIRVGFAMLGHGVNADLCNIKVQKQPDGSYNNAVFVVRASPQADLPSEGMDWPISLISAANKRIGDGSTVSIKLAGGAAPGFSVALEPPYTVNPGGNSPFQLAQGQTIQVTMTITASGSFQGALQLSNTQGTGPNTSTVVVPETAMVNIGPSGTASQTFSVTARPTAQLGTAFFTFRAASGTLYHDAPLFPEIVASATPPPAAPANGPLPVKFPSSSGALKNRDTGTCMTVENQTAEHHDRSDGTRMVMEPCSASPAQFFTFGPNGEVWNTKTFGADGQAATVQGKCAVIQRAADGAVANDDAAIVLWTCNNGGQSNEIWTIDTDSHLINREHRKCMEPNGSFSGAQDVILRPCWGGANQKWSVVQQPAAAPVRLARSFPAASGTLKNRESGKCLTADGEARDGTRLIQAPCASSAQVFTFGPNGELQQNGRCAVLSANSTDDDTPIVLWTCNGTGQSNEMWTIDSSSHLITRDSRKCMEPNGSDPNGAAILRPCWDGGNQKWSVEPPPAAPATPKILPVKFGARFGMLRNSESGNCLTVGSDRSDGARLSLANCAASSPEQLFSFGTNGEIVNLSATGPDGKSSLAPPRCAVIQRSPDGTIDKDDSPIVLYTCSNQGQSNETWTMDSSSHLISREHQKCIESANGTVILRPCWDGGNQKWSIEQQQEAAAAPAQPVAGGTDFGQPRFEDGTTEVVTSLKMAAGSSKTLTVEIPPLGDSKNSTVDIVLQVNVSIDGTGVTLERPQFSYTLERLLPARPGFACCEVKGHSRDNGFSLKAGTERGQATVTVTATAPDGSSKTGTFTVIVVADKFKGNWVEEAVPDGVVGDGEEAPRGGSAGSDTPSVSGEPFVGAELFQKSLAEAEASAAQFAGLAAAAERAGDEVLDREQLDLLKQFSGAQQALIAQLRNSTPLAFDDQSSVVRIGPRRDTEAALREEMLQHFIEGGLGMSGDLPPSVLRVASLGFVPVLPILIGEAMEDHAIYLDCKEHGNCDYRKMVADNREPIEILINMMRDAQRIAAANFYEGLALDVVKETSDTLDSWHADKVKFPQWQAALKGLAVTKTALTVIKVLSDLQLKLMPSRIGDLYANVGDYSKTPDAPNPKVMKGGKASLKIYMSAVTPKAELFKPSQVIEFASKQLWDKLKKRFDDEKKKPGSQSAGKKPDFKPDRPGISDEPGVRGGVIVIEFDTPGAMRDHIIDEIGKRIANYPKVKEWLAKIDAPVTVGPWKKGPFLVNSDHLLTFKYDNRSTELIELGQQAKGQYFIKGKQAPADGKTAGYSYGLQGWLIKQLGNSTEGISCELPRTDPPTPRQCGLFRVGVVQVVAPQRSCDLGPVGSNCTPPEYQAPVGLVSLDGPSYEVTKDCTCVCVTNCRRR